MGGITLTRIYYAIVYLPVLVFMLILGPRTTGWMLDATIYANPNPFTGMEWILIVTFLFGYPLITHNLLSH